MIDHTCLLPPARYRNVFHCPICDKWFASEYSSCADIFYWEPCSELHARLFHHKAWKAEKPRRRTENEHQVHSV